MSRGPLEGSICLFGAPLDTGNLGVSALGLSTIAALARYAPGVTVELFDHGRGVRPTSLRIGDREVRVILRGGQITRRLYRGESLWSMYAASRFAPRLNDNVRAIDAAMAVLDISGGDSFTDLYGKKQRDLVTLPKLIALRRRRPLVLLPQTFGPFHDERSVRMARDILRGAEKVWARDPNSYERLRELLGVDFDPDSHFLGADVAFTLPAADPGDRLRDAASWLAQNDPTIGVNISGLLYNDPGAAARRFGLRAHYPSAMELLVRRMLGETERRVLLVPHVPGPGTESDTAAVRDLARRFDGEGRVCVLPSHLGADEVKHVIARTEWFVGARMHSTIAALSTRTPTAAVAYSDKFQGVFDDCGVGHRVYDARRSDTEELAEQLFQAWRTSDEDAALLRAHLPGVEQAVHEQFEDIVGTFTTPRVNKENGGD